MNRRNFFKAAVGGTAVVVSAYKGGWGMDLVKRLLAAIARAPSVVQVSMPTAHEMLAAAYRKRTTALYAAFKHRVEEYVWLQSIPSEPKRLLPV